MIRPKNKIKECAFLVSLIFIFSYLLNFVWESFHAVFLYEGHNIHAAEFVLMIGYAAILDSLLILGMYSITAILWKNFFWINQMNKQQNYAFITIGLVIAAIIEYRGVFLLQKWSYSLLMPTIFGIGLSPLLQLSTTGILAVRAARGLLY